MFEAAAFIGELITAYCEDRQPFRYRGLGLSDTRHVDASIIATRAALNDFLREQRWFIPLQTQTDRDIYTRGDFEVTRLPCDRALRWLDTPVVLTVTYVGAGPACELMLSLISPADLVFTRDARDFYQAHLHSEVREVTRFIAQPRGWGTARSAQHHQLAADLKLLGLEPGASREEIESAFREAALRYHPDRHSGQGVPRHLVELSENHFKSITAAHDRLRARMGG